MESTLEEIRRALIENINPKVLASSNRFFKKGETAKIYGVSMPNVNKISKNAFTGIKDLSKQEIFNLCEKLWQSNYLEESVIACNFT